MKKETLKLLQEGDDLWKWAERNEPRPEGEEEKTDLMPQWLRRVIGPSRRVEGRR